MKLVYNGAHPVIYVIDGPRDDIQAGVPVDIEDSALAKKLLEQDTWTVAGGRTSKAASTTTQESK